MTPQSSRQTEDATRPALLGHRVVIVTGKGGTGKTTVVAALAAAAARRGLRVLAAETGRDEHLPRLLAKEPSGPVGYAGRELRPGLDVMRIDPFDAMAEYLVLQFGGRAIIERGLRSHGLREILEAAPGWRELITLGKLWHVEQAREPDGRSRYDLIVVDAPATGHGVTFLDVPRVVHGAVRAGPLGRNAGMVEELILDPQRTLVLPVGLAEELPARETAELVIRLRTEVGVSIDRIVVNAVAREPFPEACRDLPERLAALPADCDLHPLPPAPALAACAAYLHDRYELNRGYVRQIADRTRLPLLLLPHLTRGVAEPGALELLGERLLAPQEVAGQMPAAEVGR